MALGGYKFAGRYCNKGSLTDAQWILLMHKTKVAAFMAANTLANAGWDYHMTGSPDGNYHCLDSAGNNYVTCFYNQTADRYFAIYTLCNHTNSGTDSGMVKVILVNNTVITTSTTKYYVGKYASNFFRIGQVEIVYNTALDTTTNGITRLIPAGNLGIDTSDEGSSGFGKTNTLFAKSSVMFGFAIKNDSIIILSGEYASTGSLSDKLCASVASGHGFAELCSAPYDTGTTLQYNCQSTSTSVASNYESAVRMAPASTLLSPLFQVIMSSGVPTNTSGLYCVPLAAYNEQITNLPFNSFYVCELVDETTKIRGKGQVKIDLISTNFPGHQQGLYPSLYSTVANGNYLCVRYSGSASSASDYGVSFSLGINSKSTFKRDTAIYFGWDPSNPDITQQSAWTEYTGA